MLRVPTRARSPRPLRRDPRRHARGREVVAACVEARQSTRVAMRGDFWRQDLRETQRALVRFRQRC